MLAAGRGGCAPGTAAAQGTPLQVYEWPLRAVAGVGLSGNADGDARQCGFACRSPVARTDTSTYMRKKHFSLQIVQAFGSAAAPNRGGLVSFSRHAHAAAGSLGTDAQLSKSDSTHTASKAQDSIKQGSAVSALATRPHSKRTASILHTRTNPPQHAGAVQPAIQGGLQVGVAAENKAASHALLGISADGSSGRASGAGRERQQNSCPGRLLLQNGAVDKVKCSAPLWTHPKTEALSSSHTIRWPWKQRASAHWLRHTTGATNT